MKKTLIAITAIVVALMAGTALGTAADMLAGNPKNGANVVGTVTVTDDGIDLTVTYLITDPNYVITETHLHVATDPGDLPQTKKGNAIPGQFDYSDSNDVSEGVTTVTYVIPLPAGAPPVYVAAHAVVAAICDCEPCDIEVPETVTVSVLFDHSLDSYFVATITNGGGALPDGDYAAFCIDTDHNIDSSPPVGIYDGADIYLSCDPGSLEGIVEYPENLGKANWILNNITIGDISPGCGSAYTWQDIQRALWELLDDNEYDHNGNPIPDPPGPISGIGTEHVDRWLQCRVDEMIGLAEEDYVPGCGEVVGVVLIPWEFDEGLQEFVQKQALLVVVPAPCCWCDETAWAGVEGTDDPGPDDGDGYTIEFPGKDWSMYFIHPELE